MRSQLRRRHNQGAYAPPLRKFCYAASFGGFVAIIGVKRVAGALVLATAQRLSPDLNARLAPRRDCDFLARHPIAGKQMKSGMLQAESGRPSLRSAACFGLLTLLWLSAFRFPPSAFAAERP